MGEEGEEGERWTAEDNLHAYGAAACTHQQEVQALQKEIAKFRARAWCEDNIEDILRRKNSYMNRCDALEDALQKIVDDGSEESFAYGVACAALANIPATEEPK